MGRFGKIIKSTGIVILISILSWGLSSAGQKFKFAESNPVGSNQHQMAFNYGKHQMCKILGAEFISADANLSASKQIADIDTFILQKVNGITSWTLDQGAATAVYQRANIRGIPLVTENSPGNFVNTVFVQEQNMTR
ncbi:MAG: sugar ABC transporter substrate-binding protein, partial [Candidatus Moranbacteria bacterium]|nr:sugar ABC transporter substrate-binding protein [Candidatus Moranbacteria bacterium]